MLIKHLSVHTLKILRLFKEKIMRYTFDLKTVVSVFISLSLLTTPTFMVMASIETNNQMPLLKNQSGIPPQAAIEICLSKTENSVCEFQGPQENEEGTCEFTPDKQYYACKPNRQERRPMDSIENNQVKQYPSHLSDKNN